MKNSSRTVSRPTGTNCFRRAAAATEAAVVLPILLTLTLGAVDFGRVFGLSVELSNAVQSGAEYGATHRPTTLSHDSWVLGIRTAVLDELTDMHDIDTSRVTITVNLLADAQGNQQVEVTASYLFTTLVSWPLVPNQVALQSQMVMRQYR